METLRRLFLNRAIPDADETLMVKTDNSLLREYMCVRKTKLYGVCILIIIGLINTINMAETYETSMSKGILTTIVCTEFITLFLLVGSLILWDEQSAFILGFYAFVINSLKLLILFVPYSYVIHWTDETFFEDLQFIFAVLVPMYLPYLTIMMLFKRNTFFLSKLIDTLNTWKVLEMIYVPINMFIYSIVLNLTTLPILKYGLDRSLISIIYILWILGIAETILLRYEYIKTANVMYILWVIVLLTTLSTLDELLGSGLVGFVVRFAVSTAISGIKLNWLCKDTICYIYDIKFNDRRLVEQQSQSEQSELHSPAEQHIPLVDRQMNAELSV